MRSVPSLARQRREVQLAQRLLDEAALVLLVERLARDLLGGEDRQVGDLVADLLDRAARLGLDVALGLLEQLLALGLGLLHGRGFGGLAGLACAGDDLLRLLTRLRE